MILLLVAVPQLAADQDPYRGYSVLGGKESCCGGRDCAMLADDDVVVRRDGYYIKSRGYMIPKRMGQPGPDVGHFHLCEFPPGTPRCFLIPSPGI